MLSLTPGHSAEYLTQAVAAGRESYYTNAVTEGEPPGVWQGRAAAALGLEGLVDHQDMEALFSEMIDPTDVNFRNPDAWGDARRLGQRPGRYKSVEERVAADLAAEPDASPERRQEIRQGSRQGSRTPVSFFDATYSVQKSVTVTHAAFEAQEVMASLQGDADAAAAWRGHRLAVEDAIWAGQRAALDVLQDKAGYSRAGHHSATSGRRIDAHEFTAAAFFQHDSRDGDPQLHIHTAILNRVKCADGKWRTPDGRALYAALPEAARVAERVTEEHLTRSLGLEFRTRPDGKAREIQGGPAMDAAMEMFSSRRRAVTGKAEELVKAFREMEHREPTALEMNRLQRQATLATRRAKSHDGTTRAEQLDRWHAQLKEELANGLTDVAQGIVDRRQAQPAVARFDPDAVVDVAIAQLQEQRSTFRRSEVFAAAMDALPDHLGETDPARLRQLGEILTERARARLTEVTVPDRVDEPAGLRLQDGRSAYAKAGGARYASGEHIRAERSIQEAATERGAPAARPERVAAFFDVLAEEGVKLGADQRAAIEGTMTSGAKMESLVGPAGTGKSYTLGNLARAWTRPETWGVPAEQAPRIFGLAASQIATDVLAGEGLNAHNITRWRNAQARLAEGRGSVEDEALRLRPGDLVAVDESAMASTQDVAAVHQLAAEHGAKTLLTGDHRQLAAVGAAGAMSLASGAGTTYELTEVRRFSQEWERAASLRLREGDVSALEEYRKHGRIVPGGAVEHATAKAARAWLADTVEGKRSIMVVDTNEQAAQVASELRAELVRLGRVAEGGVPISQGNAASVGDLVQARSNDWDLGGWDGNRRGPINRESYRVTETREDGSLVGERVGDGQRISLPADYVAEHLALDYASTVHSAQGLTVDTAHTVVTNRSSAASMYVAMTRGRDGNTAYATTVAVPEDSPPGQVSKTEERDALAVLSDVMAREQEERLSAIETGEESLAEARSTETKGDRMRDAAEFTSSARTAAVLDELASDGRLTEGQRRSMAADAAATGQLDRLLRAAELAGHDPGDVLREAVEERSLDGAASVSSVLHSRVQRQLAEQLVPTGDHFADRVPLTADDSWNNYLSNLAEEADERSRELGGQVAEARPRWATEALGQPPADPMERLDWEDRAGRVAAYREMNRHDDDVDALGPAPKAGQVEHHAAWHSGWRALGRPEAQAEEALMSDGRLRVRVRAYEREENWAPTYVADDLEGTHREAAKLRQDAALAAARGEQEQAERARGMAEVLGHRTAELEQADRARAEWYSHTAAGRTAADRARAELVDRGKDPAEQEGAITAAELLDQQAEGQRVEDPHREVTDEVELADVREQRDADTQVVEPVAEQAETAVPDIREVSEPVPAKEDEGKARVASAEDSAAAVERAQASLAEVRQRQQTERDHAAEERSRSDDGAQAQRSSAARDRSQEDVAELV